MKYFDFPLLPYLNLFQLKTVVLWVRAKVNHIIFLLIFGWIQHRSLTEKERLRK